MALARACPRMLESGTWNRRLRNCKPTRTQQRQPLFCVNQNKKAPYLFLHLSASRLDMLEQSIDDD